MHLCRLACADDLLDLSIRHLCCLRREQCLHHILQNHVLPRFLDPPALHYHPRRLLRPLPPPRPVISSPTKVRSCNTTVDYLQPLPDRHYIYYLRLHLHLLPGRYLTQSIHHSLHRLWVLSKWDLLAGCGSGPLGVGGCTAAAGRVGIEDEFCPELQNEGVLA